MGDIHSEFKRAREIRCELVDQIVESPQHSTTRVLAYLTGAESVKTGNFSNWDLICFSALYLAGNLAIVPDFKKEVESVCYKLMEAHYFHGGDFGLYDENILRARFAERLKQIESDITKDNSNTPIETR